MLKLQRLISTLMFLVFVCMGVFSCDFLQSGVQSFDRTPYSFSNYYESLPTLAKQTIAFCDMPVDSSISTIDRCTNTGKLPTMQQATLWANYPVWVLCNEYGKQYACKQLAN